MTAGLSLGADLEVDAGEAALRRGVLEELGDASSDAAAAMLRGDVEVHHQRDLVGAVPHRVAAEIDDAEADRAAGAEAARK